MGTGFEFGIIGIGNMGLAIAKAIVKSGVAKPEAIVVSSRSGRIPPHAEKLGLQMRQSNLEVVTSTKIVIIAVKPKDVKDVAASIKTFDGKYASLLISVAAGLSLDFLEKEFPSFRVARAMPNMGCEVQESATGYCLGRTNLENDKQQIENIFNSCGRAYNVTEADMDVVTGLSGSGPAYIFILIEALADAGVKNGLRRDVAVGLATQTVYGSAKMLLCHDPIPSPASLKDQIASPGGTTIHGIAALERTGFRHSVISAVDAATQRSAELRKQ